MKPLIGLTPIVDAGRDSLWMLPGYMQGLEAVGGIGMMLPLTDDAAMLKDIVDRVDGLLLTGGNDVAPVLYGETKETFCGENAWRPGSSSWLCRRTSRCLASAAGCKF